MPKISRSSMWLVLAILLVTLAPATGAVLGDSLASRGAGSQAQAITGSEEQIIAQITPQEAFTLLRDNNNNRDFHVIETRSFDACELAGVISTLLVPIDYVYYRTPGGFRRNLGYLNKSRAYLLYGSTGELNESALAIMEELGFREVYSISGGLDAWKEAGLPVAKVGECGAE